MPNCEKYRYNCKGSKERGRERERERLAFVTIESGVALLAAALEGLLARAVHAAGQAHAPRAVWAEPPELARAGVGSGAVALASRAFGALLRCPASSSM